MLESYYNSSKYIRFCGVLCLGDDKSWFVSNMSSKVLYLKRIKDTL